MHRHGMDVIDVVIAMHRHRMDVITPLLGLVELALLIAQFRLGHLVIGVATGIALLWRGCGMGRLNRTQTAQQ